MSYQVTHLWVSLWFLRNFIAGPIRYPQLFDAIFTLLRCKREYSGAMQYAATITPQQRSEWSRADTHERFVDFANFLLRRQKPDEEVAAINKRRFNFVSPSFDNNAVTKADWLLHTLLMRAPKDRFRRKNRPNEIASRHSGRVADTARSFGRFIYGDDNGKLNGLTILAILHDVFEDFKGTFKKVTRWFDETIAADIAMVTTPDLGTLSVKYKDITSAILGKSLDSRTAKNALKKLANLKKQDKPRYKLLRSALEKQHKLDRSKGYSLNGNIVKAVDNIDALSSDAIDIRAVRILVVADKKTAPKVRGIKLVTLADIERKIVERLELHQAFMARFKVLRHEYAEAGRPELKTSNFNRMLAQFDQYIEGEIKGLREAAQISLSERSTLTLHQPPVPVKGIRQRSAPIPA